MSLFGLFKKEKKLTENELKWNKMWNLWVDGEADSPYAELMTYQSEVNNGGHVQYFDNMQESCDLEKEMTALESVLPEKLKSNLARAYEAYSSIADDDEFEKISSECDNAFWENEGEINRLLEAYAADMRL